MKNTHFAGCEGDLPLVVALLLAWDRDESDKLPPCIGKADFVVQVDQ